MVSPLPKSSPTSGHAPSSRERSLVPVGMATILPQAAKHVRFIESQLLRQLSLWGYDEIILPTFEYLDVLAPGLEAELLETCYQFIDRTTGRTLLLRPDATAQVARTVAMGLTGTSLPQRLSYRTSVFRYEPEHAGRGREIFQVGAELIGADDVEADCEVISLLGECLHAMGLKCFTISLGHVGFINGLLKQSGLSPQGQKLAEQAAARKDLPRLEEVLASEGIPKSRARAIREAPELMGQEEVLDRGRVLAAGDPVLLAPLERLRQLHQLLCSSGYRDSLLLDLGEFRGFDYYDGVVFDVFAQGVGTELGGGGRYDHLIGRFGRNLPSTGFALDLDRLYHAVDFPEQCGDTSRVDYLVVGPRRLIRRVIKIAGILRKRNRRVVQQTVRGIGHTMVSNALAAGSVQGADAVIVVGGLGADQDRVALFDTLKEQGVKSHRKRVLRPVMKKITLSELMAIAGGARRHAKVSN